MKLLRLAVLALLVGCSAAEPRLDVGAGDCWGHADCASGLATTRSALGADVGAASSSAAVRASTCGPIVDCAAAPEPVATETSTPAAVAVANGAPEPTTPVPSAPEADTPAPPPEATPEPVAAAGGGCEGVTPGELEKAASLQPKEILCLSDIAKGVLAASDADRQVAAIALYNHKASGWPAAVEAALKRPNLRNAPALNFAGIKPAYDGGQYGTVVSRADRVWKNLGKGYQLSGQDKSFLVEFACRAAGQLALQGDAPGSGLDWCERWYARASKAGQDTGPIQDLIDQLE